MESVENDDHREIEEGEPSGVWLKLALEDKCVSVYSLGLECLVELNICDANRAPREESSNGSEVLEPFKNYRRATFLYGQVRE